MLRVSILLLTLSLFSYPGSTLAKGIDLKDRRVVDLINATSGSDEILKIQYVGYFSGVIDATMNMGLHLKLWCFPSPMPTMQQFSSQYGSDYLEYVSEVGSEKAEKMQIDQMLLMSWGKRYRCK